MNRLLALFVIALAMSLSAKAQDPATQSGTPPVSGDKQSNAASATQDNSAISGDQVTKPAGAKGSTVIGCLSAPDPEGHLMLRNMQYRSGIEVLGPNDLNTAAGQKVKLTGKWVPLAAAQKSPTSAQEAAGKQEARRFQASSFEVLAEKCSQPAENTPMSKKKEKQQKAASATQNNPQ
jgi:hypothetical protein